jgi:tRNA-dihydrouridine synthase
MRRHYSQYFKGIAHFKETRSALVQAGTYSEVSSILEQAENEFSQVVI